jgi:hypothetical protein
VVYVDTEPPPTAWHQGNRFVVYVHLSILEDYHAVEGNLQAGIDNPASVKPIRCRFDWRYGPPNGAPPEAHSHFPTRLPKPPRVNDDDRGGRNVNIDRLPEPQQQEERELCECALQQQQQRVRERERVRAARERAERERAEHERVDRERADRECEHS